MTTLIKKDYHSYLASDQSLGREKYDLYIDILDTAPENPAKNLFRFFINRTELIDSPMQGYGYDPASHRIYLDTDQDLYRDPRGQAAGFVHELAHWIDYEMGWQMSGHYGVPYSVEYSGGMLFKTMRRELQEYLKKLHPDPDQARADLFEMIRSLPASKNHSLSVLCDGLFQGRYTSRLPYGQSRWYWGEGKEWQNRVTKEIFAELTEAHLISTDSLEILREIFPETLSVFDEILSLMEEDLPGLNAVR